MSDPPSAPSAFAFHEAPTQPRAPRSRPVTPESPLVLVVEDDEDARGMYAASLAEMGYRTASESSGESGLEVALHLRPAAILMDVAMPGIDGIEATRVIKADARTRGALVIVVTAHGAMSFDAARQAGCDAYFCKPFNPFALDRILRARTLATTERTTDASTDKHCACGRVYTPEQWLALPLCGRMHLPDGTDVELRNCKCGSSLAMRIAEG